MGDMFRSNTATTVRYLDENSFFLDLRLQFHGSTWISKAEGIVQQDQQNLANSHRVSPDHPLRSVQDQMDSFIHSQLLHLTTGFLQMIGQDNSLSIQLQP